MHSISKPKTIIISAIIAGVIFMGIPLVTQAAGAIVYVAKEFGLDIVARLIASNLLGNTSKKTVELIKTKGRDGGASLVRDWRSFIVRSDQRGENVFRSQIDYVTTTNKVCPGSRSALNQIFGGKNVPGIDIGQLGNSLRANNLDLFQTRVKCTVPDIVWNDFQQDFQRGGGWETWSRLVEPQNNRYGLLAISVDELNTQRSVERKADEGETRASGFLPKRGPCQGQGENRQCVLFGKIVTPKQILEKAGVKTVDSSWDWLTSSDEISEIIVIVVNSAFARLNDFMKSKTDGRVDLGSASDIRQDAERERARQDAIDSVCVSNCQDLRDNQCTRRSRLLTCEAADGEDIACTDSTVTREYYNCLAEKDAQGTCAEVCRP